MKSYEFTATVVPEMKTLLQEMKDFMTEGWEAFAVVERTIFFKREKE